MADNGDGSGASSSSTTGSRPPNIVLIVADDLGYADVGFTQRTVRSANDDDHQKENVFQREASDGESPPPEVKTPNIDALAEEGIVFTSGHTSGQVCSPTRAGLMLGRYQQAVGVYSAGEGGFGMPILEYSNSLGQQEHSGVSTSTGFLNNVVTGEGYRFINPWMPQFLKPHLDDHNDNYIAGVFGKWHLGDDIGLRADSDGIYRHHFGTTSRVWITYTNKNAGTQEQSANNPIIENDTSSSQNNLVYPKTGPILGSDKKTAIIDGVPNLFDNIRHIGQAGSPYHPLYRNFDVHYNFMGRGSKDYWDPNGIFQSKDPNSPNLGKTKGLDDRQGTNDDSEEPTSAWDADQPPYYIHNERIPPNYLTNKITEAAVDFIQTHAGGQRPFFAYVPYNTPHAPSQTPYHMNPITGELDRLGTDSRRYNGLSREEFFADGIEDAWFDPAYTGDWFPDPLFIYETYKDKPNGLRDFLGAAKSDDSDRRLRAITTCMIRWMDKGIGQIVAALKDPNGDGNTDDSVFENTIIVFLSDNGGAPRMRASNGPLQGSKNTIYEGGHRVPFFMTWENYLKPLGRMGSRIDVPITSLDLLPTFLDVNGWNDASIHPMLADYPTDGKSLLPLINGTVNKLHDYLFWADGDTIVEGAVRKDNWKLILFRHGGNEQPPPTFELFDLSVDLQEKINLAGCYPDLVEELIIRFLVFMSEMGRRRGERLPNRRLPQPLQNYSRTILPIASETSPLCATHLEYEKLPSTSPTNLASGGTPNPTTAITTTSQPDQTVTLNTSPILDEASLATLDMPSIPTEQETSFPTITPSLTDIPFDREITIFPVEQLLQSHSFQRTTTHASKDNIFLLATMTILLFIMMR